MHADSERRIVSKTAILTPSDLSFSSHKPEHSHAAYGSSFTLALTPAPQGRRQGKLVEQIQALV